MTNVADIPDAPPREILFKRRIRPGVELRNLWRHREIVRTLAERDFRARYKQALLGASWAILTPVVLMLVFTLVFKRVASIDTSPVPYALYAYVGLVPWTFFSSALNTGGQSLVNNNALVSKLYCPREVFPLAGVAVAAVDAVLATSVVGVMFIGYGFAPKSTSYWVPLLLLVQGAFTVGVTLFVSGVFVYFRDLRQALPMILQLGLLATPVAWPIEKIPAAARLAYSMVNPLGPVIDGYRRAVLYGRAPRWRLVVPATGMSLLWLVVGYLLLKRLETRLADVA
jgi:ABC-2 type transport system permease protein/lipopolysaccharide transport system permease protein